MTSTRKQPGSVERYLTVAEVAERRIAFVRVGRHVRIPESALDEYLTAGRVEPIRPAIRPGRVA